MTATTEVPVRLDFDAHAPAFARALSHLDNAATKQLDQVDFDHRLRELVRIRASQLNGCAYCIDQHTKEIDELTVRIEEQMRPFLGVRDLLVSIPGISTTVADVVIAETGADMSRFPTAGHLASWAGVCPGSNESAGRVKSTHTRPGNPYLKGVLGAAAMSAARSRGTYFAARYRRIAARRGPMRALVALEHSMLIAIWNMLVNGAFYDELGADYFNRLDPGRATRRAVDQLRRLGYSVQLEPITALTG